MIFEVITFNQNKIKNPSFGVSEGKYTIGLGQLKMGTCSDREDINSLALSAFDKLVASYGIDLKKIGRLEIGTETMVDKSKSVKR